MAFGLNLGDFGKSKAQVQKEREEYERSIFPFGESQKENVKTLISMINGNKLYQIDIMVAFIEAKQKYLKEPDAAAIGRRIRQIRIKQTMDQIKQIVSLVILDAQCQSPDSLPQLEQVRDFAATLVLEA